MNSRPLQVYTRNRNEKHSFLNILKVQMQPKLCSNIFNDLKRILNNQLPTEKTLEQIKTHLDQQYKGKWSVISGIKYSAYLDTVFIKQYMWVDVNKTNLLLFRKTLIVCSLNQDQKQQQQKIDKKQLQYK